MRLSSLIANIQQLHNKLVGDSVLSALLRLTESSKAHGSWTKSCLC